jgi:hypothetical protein
LGIDTETNKPPELAAAGNERAAWFRSVRHYPELVALLPQRPPEAVDCPDCLGTGMHQAIYANPVLRHVICGCGGSGWRIPRPDGSLPTTLEE